MIKLGTYFASAPTLSAEERLRIIKGVGFDTVGFFVYTLLRHEKTGITPELCARIGLEIENVHLSGSGTHALWAEGEEGDKMVELFCREIEGCREIGVKTGVLHAVYGYEIPAPMGKLGLSRFERIVECAEKNGVSLALENSLHDAYLCYVLDNIKSPNLRFCFDSGHHHAFAREMPLLSKYGDRLAATHLQDNDGTKDMHLMPLDGTIDWQATARLLARTPHARQSICAEIVTDAHRKFPDRSAAELKATFADSLALEQGLMQITDGYVAAYAGMSFEAYFARLYTVMRRVADMIETAARQAEV